MFDIGTAAHTEFETLLNQSFTTGLATDGTLALELIEVLPQTHHDAAAARRGFSLIFRGPAQPVLPQQIHPLLHARTGELPVFLVPIGPDQHGMRYEAVFG